MGILLLAHILRSRPASAPVPAADTALDDLSWHPLGDPTAANRARTADVSEAQIEQLCSTCHVLPSADLEPKWMWPKKLTQMYGYIASMPQVVGKPVPPMDSVLAYWESRAPDSLTLPPDALGSPPSPLAFRRHNIRLAAIPNPSSISCVQFVKLSDDGPTQLLISDMRQGVVVLWMPTSAGGGDTAQVIGRVAHPSRTQVVDLDGDGLRDVLVANLGDYWPVERTRFGPVVAQSRPRPLRARRAGRRTRARERGAGCGFRW